MAIVVIGQVPILEAACLPAEQPEKNKYWMLLYIVKLQLNYILKFNNLLFWRGLLKNTF